MVQVTLTDASGGVHNLTGEEGLSIMEAAKAQSVPGIMADCGGACSCATCHIIVDPDWYDRVGQPDDVEFAMLDMVSDVSATTSRLSCQIKLTAALNGLRATVAPTV